MDHNLANGLPVVAVLIQCEMISLENIRVLLSHVPLAGLTEYQLLIVPNTYAYSYPC
jgi:hypothetical protein